MNLEKFTRKSMEAIQNAQSLAGEYGNQELTQAHLLLSLLRQDEGLIGGLMASVTPDAASLTAETEKLILPNDRCDAAFGEEFLHRSQMPEHLFHDGNGLALWTLRKTALFDFVETDVKIAGFDEVSGFADALFDHTWARLTTTTICVFVFFSAHAFVFIEKRSPA